MRLLLIRHGESEADLLDVHEGRADFALTERGHRQAKAMAAYVAANYHIDRIYASTLTRAMQTARHLSDETGIPIQPEPDLMEFNNGLLAGLPHKEAYSYYGSLISDCHPKSILELSTGAGTGTSLAASAIPDDARLFTTDMDFACLGNAVGIANYHRKAVIPVCANFWYLPFRNRSFDLVCTMNGLDESREIQRTLAQVRNVLKPGGYFLVFSRKNAYMRQRGILSEFGFTEAETQELLRKCRMYSSAEHLVELCASNGLEVKSQKEFSSESNLTWVVSQFQMVDENKMD